MEINYVDKLHGSKVIRFVAMAWVSLMDEGQWDSNSILISDDLQCVYATEGKKIIGCLTFHIDESTEAVVNIAYVLPANRGQGTYRAMHSKFVEVAREQKATQAVNICYPSNEEIQKTVEKLGYKPYVVHWVLPI
jgi:GNAT superfamily N-acetyltransferase